MTDDLVTRLDALAVERDTWIHEYDKLRDRLAAADAERDAWKHQCDGANRLYNEAVAERDEAVELLRGWTVNAVGCWHRERDRTLAFLARLRDRST